MNVEQAKEIIRSEALVGCVWFDENIRASSVVIRKDDSGWRLFHTDERAVPWSKSVRMYQSESDALQDLVDRLRRRKEGAATDRKLFGR